MGSAWEMQIRCGEKAGEGGCGLESRSLRGRASSEEERGGVRKGADDGRGCESMDHAS